jgi:hypothetical protein
MRDNVTYVYHPSVNSYVYEDRSDEEKTFDKGRRYAS